MIKDSLLRSVAATALESKPQALLPSPVRLRNNGGIAITAEAAVPREDAELNMATISLVREIPSRRSAFACFVDDVFAESDKADSQLVAIVNRKLAEHYWPGDNPWERDASRDAGDSDFLADRRGRRG